LQPPSARYFAAAAADTPPYFAMPRHDIDLRHQRNSRPELHERPRQTASQ
jgi:hypothetical protein